MSMQQVLLAGRWQEAAATGTFQAENPASGESLPEIYPLSRWDDCEKALAAAATAQVQLRAAPPESRAAFLDRYAERIEARADEIVATAHRETALPVSPRLADVELPRTTDQLRQAAAAAREGSWALPTIDTKLGIRSVHEPLGPVAVFGPNNFPLAFNSVAGGDFAAAIAAGNAVIAKANSSHPATTRLLAEEAHLAADQTGQPPALVQMLYRLDHQDGERLVADPRLGATAYTGSRQAGLTLKAAADAAGRPIYLELSSINPVAVLPGALEERGEEIAAEFTISCLMGTGQFCTSPGLIVLLAGQGTERFITTVTEKFRAAPVGTLLSSGVRRSLAEAVDKLTAGGAELLVGGAPDAGQGYSYANTLLRVDAQRFLADPALMQTEAFGNSSLLVVADDVNQAGRVVDSLEGNLTGTVYSATGGGDDAIYDAIAPRLRRHVGRLINDKMPTGVAVSPAMNHGGPYPATGHPGFTAVGIPASLPRFTMLACYDNVRPHRLPVALRDQNPTGKLWRRIDSDWSQADVKN